MRIQVTLQPLSYPAAVPLDQHPLASCIYEALAVASPDFAAQLHERGVTAAEAEPTDKHFKFFVFAAPALPRFDFAADERVFADGVMRWQISSPLPSLIEMLVAGLGSRFWQRQFARLRHGRIRSASSGGSSTGTCWQTQSGEFFGNKPKPEACLEQ